MMTVHVQEPVLPHATEPLRHCNPEQQVVAGVQLCPMPAHTEAWQVPAVCPAGTRHEVPAQQSLVAVHTPLTG